MSIETSRRRLLQVTGAAAAVSAFGRAAAAQGVPWSSGTEPPRTPTPAGATDCHHHIYDSHYPTDPKATLKPADATADDYKALQRRLGIGRHVVVQPSTYGVDNTLLLAALAAFGETARGVAVVNTEVSDEELHRLHAAGVRGIRFNLVQAGATTPEMMEPLAARVAPLGWHVQVHALGDQIVRLGDILSRLPCPMVFDHMGRLPQPEGAAHPAFTLIASLAQQERAWVKLSGAYMDTKIGAPNYPDTVALGASYASAAPDRMLWGSDWPHPTVTQGPKPDDAVLLDLLAAMVPDTATRTRILVQNPESVYGFQSLT